MSMEFLSEDVAAEQFETKKREYKGGPAGPRPRTETQMEWDKAVKRAYESASQVFAVQVAPDAADDARKRVDAAVRFLNLGTTAGVPKPGKVEGTVILTWKIRDVVKRGPRKPKNDGYGDAVETSDE